jgi:hypothetical protein
MLAAIGVTEAQALEHTTEWIEAALESAGMKFRIDQAVQIKSVFIGAQAAFNGEEAFDLMQETLDQLTSRGSTEASDETDFAKLEAMGVARTVTAEEAALVR